MTDDNGIAGTGIKLGITLYSLTSEFAARHYTFESRRCCAPTRM